MIDVHHQHQIDFRRQPRIVSATRNRKDIGEALALGAFGQIFHHVGLDVHAVYPALRDGVREAHREIPGSGADIRHRCVGREPEGAYDLVRLLPGVALGIVERLRPFLRVAEAVLVRGRGLPERSCPGAQSTTSTAIRKILMVLGHAASMGADKV